MLLKEDALKRVQLQWDFAKKQGWTQQKLAKALEISQPSVNQYLSGKIPLNVELIIKLAKVFDIPASILGLNGFEYNGMKPVFATSGKHYASPELIALHTGRL